MPWERKYESLRERLLTRCIDHDHPKGCWIGADRACRYGYTRQCYWIPGLKARRDLSAHVLLWVLEEFEKALGYTPTIDELYLAYLEFRSSGLELDHTCDETSCRRPDHLEPKTHRENIQDGKDRWAAKRAALEIPDTEPAEVDIEF